tara:strand:+ start:504 stop:728 length:225 start_codon:yes stop_codon:yes gene_type:complete
MTTQKEEQKIIDKIINLLQKYDDKITMLATNQYHNLDTDDDIPTLVAKLRLFYGRQVLDTNVTLKDLEITLANI